jgi:uncharacterized membrane protein
MVGMSTQILVFERSYARRAGWVLTVLSSLAVGLYAFSVVLLPQARPPFAADLVDRWGVIAFLHFAGSGIALTCGALQFSQRLRARAPAVHRWIGRVYVSAVLGGGSAGLVMATASSGGIAARIGFGLLAVLWLSSTARAYVAIRQRDIRTHRTWMFRSFGLTFAAVTLRIYLPLSQIAGIPFDVAYPVIAWVSWVPNLLLANLLQREASVASYAPGTV